MLILVFQVLDENRGSSYFTGADEDWRRCPSVHNFIKVYFSALQCQIIRQNISENWLFHILISIIITVTTIIFNTIVIITTNDHLQEYNPWVQGGARGSTRIFEIPFKVRLTSKLSIEVIMGAFTRGKNAILSDRGEVS